MKFYLRNAKGLLVRGPLTNGYTPYAEQFTTEPGEALGLPHYGAALSIGHETTKRRELAHGFDLTAIFSVRVWVPGLDRFVTVGSCDFIEYVERLHAAASRALPYLERQLAAQGDAPEHELLNLQHHLATLLQSPGAAQPEPTTKP